MHLPNTSLDETTIKALSQVKKPIHIIHKAIILGSDNEDNSLFFNNWATNILPINNQVSFGSRILDLPQPVKLQCWILKNDIPHSMAKIYILQATLFFIIMPADLSLAEKKQHIEKWHNLINSLKAFSQVVKIIILDNLSNLNRAEDNRTRDITEAATYAINDNDLKELLQLGDIYFLICAKTKFNFNALEIRIAQLFANIQPSQTSSENGSNSNSPARSGSGLRRAYGDLVVAYPQQHLNINNHDSNNDTHRQIKTLDISLLFELIKSLIYLLRMGSKYNQLQPYATSSQLVKIYSSEVNGEIQIPLIVNNWLQDLTLILSSTRDSAINLLLLIYDQLMTKQLSHAHGSEDSSLLLFEHSLRGFIELSMSSPILPIRQNINSLLTLFGEEMINIITVHFSARREGSPLARNIRTLFSNENRAPDFKNIILAIITKLNVVKQNSHQNLPEYKVNITAKFMNIFDLILVAAGTPSTDSVNSQSFYRDLLLPIILSRLSELNSQQIQTPAADTLSPKKKI